VDNRSIDRKDETMRNEPTSLPPEESTDCYEEHPTQEALDSRCATAVTIDELGERLTAALLARKAEK